MVVVIAAEAELAVGGDRQAVPPGGRENVVPQGHLGGTLLQPDTGPRGGDDGVVHEGGMGAATDQDAGGIVPEQVVVDGRSHGGTAGPHTRLLHSNRVVADPVELDRLSEAGLEARHVAVNLVRLTGLPRGAAEASIARQPGGIQVNLVPTEDRGGCIGLGLGSHLVAVNPVAGCQHGTTGAVQPVLGMVQRGVRDDQVGPPVGVHPVGESGDVAAVDDHGRRVVEIRAVVPLADGGPQQGHRPGVRDRQSIAASTFDDGVGNQLVTAPVDLDARRGGEHPH